MAKEFSLTLWLIIARTQKMSNIDCLIDGEGIRPRRHSHTGPPGIGMLPRGTRYRSSPEAKAPLQPHDDVPGQGPREQHAANIYIATQFVLYHSYVLANLVEGE